MANKFQKSVLERLEQDAARQKQPIQQKRVKEILEVVVEKKEEEEITIPLKQELSVQSVVEMPISTVETDQPVFTQVFQPTNIGDYLWKDTQRIAKNKTFYLDTDIITCVKSTARSQGVTDSKLVNDILRRVLGV